MELLRIVAMPFQLGSLLFVALTSLLLTVILASMQDIVASAGPYGALLGMPAFLLLAPWLTRYTFMLLDDVANGVREAAAVSAEMLSPWADLRCWVHPVITVAVALTLILLPQVPRLPVLIACGLLFPASLAAIAMSGRALDALNPFAVARMMRGLAHYYPLAVLWLALCLGAGWLLLQSGSWLLVKIAGAQLLLLLACAFIGGAVYARRLELGFEPRVNPERAALRDERDLLEQRQQMIDRLFAEVRTRRHDNALATVRQWLETATPRRLPGDVNAILTAGANWSDKRSFATLLRGMAPLLIALRQPAPALETVEAGLAALPGFTLEQEGDAVRMIHYAVQTGRRKLAATLLANFMVGGANRDSPGAELQALQAQLRDLRQSTV